ncbi:tetratricopeptide repeat protein [Mucilaginibacter sp. ZT4R22]|uniref:histidine kinase n=1 Tax=Mucilaginibacter pankratovii TaxID=2772110 RepID=A0ABR7WUL2_9SPHI|nr:histidine kinase dimerization/phosphoacceptor domain -containing protein [Mucilaginibacter pankratovii]MBD1364922.1 tetratricopeptide repeat protein [Mucilaginibacter pankratovii]
MNKITYKRLLAFFVLSFVCLQAWSQAAQPAAKSEGDRYMASAKAWTLKNDSVKCNADIRTAISIYLKKGQVREAAEAWLKMEEYYQFFHGTGYDKRIAYYEQALALFTSAGANDRAAATLNILGDFYQVESNFPKSLSALKKSLLLYQSTNKKDLQGLYDLIGSVNSRLGNYDEALKYGLLAVRTAEAVGDTSLMLCTIFNRLGVTYYTIKQYDQSLIYFQKSLLIAQKNHDVNSVILLAYNVANTLKLLHKPREGYLLMKEMERQYHPKDLENKIFVNICYLNMLVALKQPGPAKRFCDTLLRFASAMNENDRSQELIQQTAALYFMAAADYKNAKIHATKYQEIGRRTSNNAVLSNAYKTLYQIDSLAGDEVSELRNFRKYTELRNLLFNEKTTKQIAQLEIQYKTEKKDQELKSKESNIAILKKQAQLQATAQKLYIAATILLALLLGLSYNRYLLKQRVNRKLQVQQTEINLQNRSLTNLIAEKDNLLEEKEWLMKEIHHRVKNNLQIVISLLNTQSSYLSDDLAYKAIRESRHRMQSISLIHQKLYQSENLALVNMPAYIGDLVQYLSDSFDTASRIKFDVDIAPIELDVTKSVPLGLILNEAITNSIKYAFPQDADGKIKITLADLGEGNYELQISDNGIGTTAAASLSKSKTLGMSLMRGLSKQLSGTFTVENRDGLTIIIKFINEKLSKPIKNHQSLSS